MRLGLYGGTFDPIHLGHLIVAEFAREALALDRLDFVPAGNPWQKAGRDLTPGDRRLAMVRAAIGDNPGFGVDTIELDTPGPSYSADTVQAIRARLAPGDELFYLVGADSLANLHTWHQPERLLANCTLVALRRPGYALADSSSTLPGVRYLESPLVDISSTDIRRRLQDGRSIRYWVPEAVRQLLEARASPTAGEATGR